MYNVKVKPNISNGVPFKLFIGVLGIVITLLLAIFGSLNARLESVEGQTTGNQGQGERIAAIEEKTNAIDARLIRVEDKLDYLIELNL